MKARFLLLFAALCTACAVAKDPGSQAAKDGTHWWQRDIPACKPGTRPFPDPGKAPVAKLVRGRASGNIWVDPIRLPAMSTDWITRCPVLLNKEVSHPDANDCELEQILKSTHSLLVRDVAGVRRAAVFEGSTLLFDLAFEPAFTKGAIAWLHSDQHPTHTVFILMKQPKESGDEKYYEVEMFKKGDAKCSVHMPTADAFCGPSTPTPNCPAALVEAQQADAGGGYEPPD